MLDTNTITFPIVVDGVDETFGTPTVVHFQSETCYSAYLNGGVNEDLGYTLMAMNGETQFVFWFDDHESKQQWITENIAIDDMDDLPELVEVSL